MLIPVQDLVIVF